VVSEHLGESLGTDFFSVREQFTDEQWDRFRTVRRFVDEEVVPVVGPYWERAEICWPLVKRLPELGIVGEDIKGYGCAGMSPMACGLVTKTFRRAESTPGRERAALAIARRWATAEKLARTAVGAADLIQRTVGTNALTGLTATVRLVVSDDLVPSVPGPMPRAQLRKAGRRRGGGHGEPVMAFGLPPAANIVPASHLSTICWEGSGFRERFGRYSPPNPPGSPNAPGS
jgi:Acyl-CoA dehydrogenase, N-terminal domain